MNKIFKVVWSKTKECYVVVSEVAKNNGGKKKVLATVFAALVATGSMLPDYVDAANNTSGGGVSSADASIAIGSGWGNSAYANTNFSIAIGDQSNANGKAAIALGRQAKTNGEEAAIAIGNQTEATSKDSTAVGSGSKSSGEYAAALGFQTKATANYATAIGSGARGYAEDSQAIGREAETSAGAFRAIAIGTLSKSSANYATSLGSSAEASAERAIAVGYKSKAKAESAISVGNLASADNTDSIAVGNGSAATANYAVAVGSGSAVSGLNGTAVGKNSQATGQSAAAFGDSAQATNAQATAIGNQAVASDTRTTAIGNQAKATGPNATVVGSVSEGTGPGATAIGTNNKAGYESAAVGLSNTVSGNTSAAFGRSNTVTGKESLAAGVRSTAAGEHNVAIGYQAATDGKATVAIGEGSKADIADGVALGSNSATTAAAGVQGFNPADSRTNTYSGLTGTAQTSTLGAVAVGNGATATRQITGLAAGKEDTDAVNVAQLRSVNLKYAGNSGDSDVRLENGTLNIKGKDLISTTANASGITVELTKGADIANDNGKAKEPTTNGVATTQNVVQAINNSYWKATAGGNTDGTPSVGNVKPGTQVTYSAGDNLKVKQTIAANGDQEYKYSLNADLKGINSISNTTTGPTMTFGSNSINITGGSLNMGNSKITNLAPGTDDKDAVNYSQIKGLRTEVVQGTGVTVAKTQGADGHDIYTVSANATGGTASTESVVKKAAASGDTNIADISVADNKNTGDAGAKYEVSVSRNAVKDAAREAVTINNGGTKSGTTYTPNADNPITVTPKEDAANHNTTYEVTFDGNKAAKQIPLTYKATNGTTTTADQTVKLDKGLNFTGGDYTTASVGADGKVTFDVNLGTAPTVTDGKPGVPGQAGAAGKDGIATVKTVVDTINNSGWKANAKANGGTLDGNSTATVVKPGDQVNFAAGKNLTVKQDLTGEHTYTYSLNKDLKDLTSVEIGGSTIKTDGDHITITSPDTTTGATPGATVTNKVANLGDEKHIKPDTYAVANDGSVTLKYVDGNGKDLTETTKITGITNQNLSNITTAGETKIKNLAKSAINMEDGKNTKASKRDVNGVDTYKVDVEGDLTGISSITNGGTNNGKISFGPNKTVTVDGDHSITLNASTGKIGGLQNLTFDPTNFTSGQAATEDQLKSVHDTLKANERHIAPTTVAASSTENKGGTANAAGTANVYKYDATNKTVTLTYNDGNGNAVNDTKAVIDFSALNTGGTTASTWTAKTSAENTTAGSEIGKHAGDASQVIGNQNSVDFQAGRNMTVTQTNDGTGNTTINYALDKDLTNLDKVVVNGENGTNGKDGVTIIGPQGATGATGMPGTNGIDGKVGITGKDGKDAVSISGKDGIGTIGLTGPQGPAGADGRGVDITTDHGTQTLNKPEANNGGKSERIVYVPKDKDGNPLKDDAGNTIKREVATMDDGLKFTGNNESTENKHKLGSLVKVQGEGVTENTTTNKLEANGEEFKSASGNIAVVADSIDKLTVKLNKNLAGINKISNGGSSITLNDTPNATTPAVTISGGNLSVGGNKVTNVDDGTDNNDAVNVKQLKAAKTEVKAGENVTVKHTTDGTDNHNIYTVSAVTPAVYTKADGTKVYKIVDPTTGAVTWNTKADGTGTNVNAGDVITSFETPANGTTPGSTTGGTMIVNNIGSAIKNQTGGDFLTKLDNANTATPNAAVNVSDLKSTADALKSNELHIRPTTSGRTGETVNQGAGGTAESYKYDATTKSVTLKYNDGTGAGVTGTEAKIDLSDLANQITSGYTFKANATANGGTVANDATTPAVATTVENGGTINYAAGKNLTVKQDIDATAKTHTYTYSLNKDLTNLDKVVVNGENGTNGKDGVTIIGPQGATGAPGMPGTNGIDGKVGIAGKDGKDAVSISGKDGIGTIGLTGPQGPAGADGRGVDITTDHGTQTLNKPEANNGGKSERIVYVPKDKDGNPLKDDAGNTIKREVATMDDGLKFTGNNESTENKHKLGSLVKVQGEGVTENTTTNKLEANGEEFKSASGNIAVVADSIDKLTVKLNKNLAGINKISNGGSSITLNDTPSATTPAVTITGGNLSMGDGTTNNKIVNLAPGTDDNDAVNYKQLKAAKTEVKAGENVTVKHTTDGTDNHNIYTVSAVTPAVYTKADGTKVYKIVDPTTGAVTWNTKADGTGTNVNAGDVITSFETPANGTTPGSTTGGTMIVNNIGSAIKNQTGGDFLTKLDNANTATPNAAVNVSDLKSTADALKANERHIAPTTVATGSTENKGGTANAAGTANVYKYDAASKTVTLTYNDGNGNAVTDTKAVIDLSNLSTGGTGASSWNIASDKVSATEGAVATGSAGTQNIADGKTVTMKAGKNLTVNQVNDGAGNASVAFSLDKNLENLDKVVVNGNDGATGQAGVSIVGPKGANGVDGNDGKVGIAGKDGKDAVSISGKDGVGHIGLQGPKGTPGTPGADGASLDISTDHGTQTLVKPEANNNDKSERIVYVPKDANGNPLKDTDGNTIKREVATMDDGLKFTGNNTGTVNKHKLGSLVKVQGEGVSATDEAAFVSASGNIAVTAENNDTLTIRLNKNLKGLNSIQLGGNTIQSNGDNITFTTNGGTTKTVATTDQLWTIQANGTDVPAKSGKVNLVAGDHITITPDAANGKMTISATGFGSMDGFNVKTSAESTTVGTHAGDTTENIKNGKTVDMQAGKNLVVTQTNDGNGNTTVNYALNKDVDLGTNGSLKAGDTTINKDGVTIANGPSVTKTGVDAGDKKITNVADGDVNATSKDAVNGSQLKKYTDAAKTTVEAGDNNVKVDADNTAADGHTNYKVSLKPVVTIGDTHKVTIDGHTGDITGLTNVNLTDPTFATKGRAATEEQLDKVLTEAKKKAVEKVQAGTAAAGDTNIATVAPKAGDTFGTAGATYEVSVSKNAVKDAAKEAVKVTSASPAITVTADNTTPHETTYKVGFDGNQAATQIPLTYKQNGGNTRTVKLSDGLNFIDGTNTKARTAADGKVTFDVMGDLTGITSISNAAGGPKMTFGGNSINVTGGNLDMGGKKITNIGKGTDPTDAARVGQLTKVTSNNHSVVVTKTTDADGAPVYDLAVTGTPGAPAADPRVDMLGEEIGRVGAQGAALSALKPIQYDPLEPTQIMAGYGNYRGNSAVALGVAHYKNESTLIHGGVSWAGGSSHMMANAGVTWKVGNRDSEAAVADRYRKGPISSAYAMQQEMAAMKAQNAGLKGEVSDLKAENEQMKAQIAAMMAKLGL
ncbi:ESPR-type extended signal peptide-containing protein [uncultured Veillonella sp.]|nr:ESPR-type extended signal peptide-containing protein [uncultured Veillonella sp.]